MLPNLSIKEPLITEYACLVDKNDEKMKLLCSEAETVNELSNCFIDQRVKTVNPTFVLFRDEISGLDELHNCIVSFRNIVAISTILREWIPNILSGDSGIDSVLYSDYFDLFPLSSYGDKYYTISTPASNSLVGNAKVKYQRNYVLPKLNFFHIDTNDEILNSLLKLWNEHFIKRRNNKRVSLFRSLQIVYSACKMPVDNFSTIYDYGMKLGFWVSAFEVLFHPGKNNYIGYRDILKKLSEVKFKLSILNRKMYKIDNLLKSNVVGKAYKEIYDNRNAFFHGNTVKFNDLNLHKSDKYPSLTAIAHIIFLISLYSYLMEDDSLIRLNNMDFTNSLYSAHNYFLIEEVLKKIIYK